MSTIAPTVDFSPNDVSDPGLAELRTLALSAMKAAPRFGEWLHKWTDTEQALVQREKARRHGAMPADCR